MTRTIEREPSSKMKERGPLMAIVVSSVIVALLVLTMVVAVLATQPL